jgi:hypothetical protein
MGISDVSIIGVGKDAYNDDLEGMINDRILPWVEDVQDDSYPVWDDYNAVQRSTYFLDREGELIYQTNITAIDPGSPEDYESFINLILNFRSSNGPSTIRVPQDMASIQDAIIASSEGDLILVSPGTYEEQIDFLDKNISLASLIYSGFDSSLLEETILDGLGEGPVVTINSGQDQSSLVMGFVIENGYSVESGGGLLIKNSSPTISRNVIRNNQAGNCGGSGGGIAVLEDSYAHIFANIIYDNIVSGDCDCVCYFGGGIYVDESSWPIIGGSVTLGNTFENNTADYGMELYREHSNDSSSWTPIYAHHNIFENCPPEFPTEVYPENGWDLDNCHSLSVKTRNVISSNTLLIYPTFPNPFNSSTTIKIYLSNRGNISINIFNLKGENIKTISRKNLNEGANYFKWSPSGIPSGVYFIKSSFNDHIQTQKVLFVK